MATPPPRLLVLQHHPTSPLGVLGERLAARGAELNILDAEHGCRLPDDAAEHDGLVVLGGVMNAYDDARCPHFPALLELIRDFGRRDRPVLGVCLGAQLVARALGAKVRLGAAPEFGFVDLEALPAAADNPVVRGAGRGLAVMQWHDDAFDLPEGAVPLLRGERSRLQAFRAGRATYAFQCHLEVTRETAAEWGRLRAKDKNNPAIAVRLGAEIVRHHDRAAAFGRAVADAWLDLAVAPGPARNKGRSNSVVFASGG